MKKIILFYLSMLILYSCGPSLQTFSDYDKAVDLSAYKTYSWLDVASIENKGVSPLYNKELNDKRIKEAVNKQMQLKRYQLNPDKAELQLHYHIIIENKTTEITEPIGVQYRPYSNTYRTSTYQYREGTLIVDLMDTKTNILIWRGWATDVITNTTRKDPEAAINNAITKIFESFPVGK